MSTQRFTHLLAFPALMIAMGAVGCRTAAPLPAPTTPAPALPEKKPVETYAEVGVYVLSLCPHAASALDSLARAAHELEGAVNIHVAFLGLLGDNGKPSDRMGEAEVAAALAHLCVQNQASDLQWLDYLKCAFAKDKFRSGRNAAMACATEVGLEARQIEECTTADDARSELVSMYATAMALGIDQSPTMVVDRRVYLGEMDSPSILAFLCHNAGQGETRPKRCEQVPPPPSVNATLLFDSRCEDPDMCDVEGEVEALHAMLPGLALTRLDYVTSEGKHLFELIRRAEPEFRQLPAILFDHSLASTGGVAKRLAPYLVSFGQGRLLPMSAGWDPRAEICGNGVDDTGNGLVDCADEACRQTLACRTENTGKVELFIMSQCPFGAAVVEPAYRAISHFGKNRKKMDLRLEFIGASRDGELASMHGQAEVDEDLRMICAQSLYAEKYLFMDYVSCRAKDYHSEDWKACLPRGMSAKKLEACATSKKGRDLLAASFELADKLGLRGSPSWILNGRYNMEGRTTEAMVRSFCEKNKLPECSTPVEAPPETDGTRDGPSGGSCQ